MSVLFVAAQEHNMQMKEHQHMQMKEHQLTAKEAKALIVSAKTPEDHMKLAAYFRNEAQQLEEKAKYHKEMGKLYSNTPIAKTGMQQHCEDFAEQASQAAKSDYKLAAEHEKMAEAARQAK
jgi:hypothetical protein